MTYCFFFNFVFTCPVLNERAVGFITYTGACACARVFVRSQINCPLTESRTGAYNGPPCTVILIHFCQQIYLYRQLLLERTLVQRYENPLW